MKYLIGILAATILVDCSEAQTQGQTSNINAEPMTMSTSESTVYDLAFTSIRGDDMPFSLYDGQVVLVVNTASQCGYTGQYAGLQELYDTFKDEGLVVLGVPSNDFGSQEPGSEQEIKSFCEINYGVEFPLTSKTTVSGTEAHEFWNLAVSELGDRATPKWNFHKVLVDRHGQFVQAYPSGVRPQDTELVAEIERLLEAG